MLMLVIGLIVAAFLIGFPLLLAKYGDKTAVQPDPFDYPAWKEAG